MVDAIALGRPLPDWQPVALPEAQDWQGRYVRLEPLAVRHAASLWQQQQSERNAELWTYLPYGPFESQAAYQAWIAQQLPQKDPQFYALCCPASGQALGVAAYLRIEPKHGVIEIGHLYFSPALQRSRAATEALFQLINRAFELGYRRVEWKCNSLNWPSRRAAQRLGFSYEGLFRQAMVVKGHNRDSCWYSIIDSEWPRLKAQFDGWLAPDNFEGDRQRQSLSVLTRPLVQTDPGLA